MSACASFSAGGFVVVLLAVWIQRAIFVTRFFAFFHSSFLFLERLLVCTGPRSCSLLLVEDILAFVIFFTLLDGQSAAFGNLVQVAAVVIQMGALVVQGQWGLLKYLVVINFVNIFQRSEQSGAVANCGVVQFARFVAGGSRIIAIVKRFAPGDACALHATVLELCVQQSPLWGYVKARIRPLVPI